MQWVGLLAHSINIPTHERQSVSQSVSQCVSQWHISMRMLTAHCYVLLQRLACASAMCVISATATYYTQQPLELSIIMPSYP
jgi:hypothetical protein